MRLLKIRLTNFIPYFGEDNEVALFDEGRRTKNVTLNIGPTGNGKTSISRAVMFCLFGEQYAPEWETMINDLAIDVAKQTRKKSVRFGVEMEIEIEGKTYIILRTGDYDTGIGKRVADTTLSVRVNGEPIKPAEQFVNEKFPPVGLMEYFIFDADDMLSLFEKNREKTIKDHINKIVGVEALDFTSDSLRDVISLYETEITEIRNKSPGISKDALDQEMRNRGVKSLAMEEINKDIQKLERLKKELFPTGRLAPEEVRLKEIVDKQHNAEEEIKSLNKQFVDNKELISNIHLLFLKEIIEKSLQMVNKAETTQSEFDNAMSTLKSTLEGKYGGVLIEENGASLIRRGIQLKEAQLEKVETLKLGQGSGIKAIALRELGDMGSAAERTEEEYRSFRKNFQEALTRLTNARSLLKQIGETEKNLKLKAKIDQFLDYDKKITELRSVLDETGLELDKIEARIRELTKGQKTTEEVDKQIGSVQKRIDLAVYMKKVTDMTKKLFLQELLTEVNQNATDFFRGVVRGDDPRLNSIVVDSDYRLNVKNQKDEALDPSTISKGNMQVALMAFFFGLSRYMQNKLPYIIDDPLIRLDVGHDKRLVTQLCKSEQQIIMHMIPGKEYTKDSFSWLLPFVNTQNWINRRRERGESSGKLRSSAEHKDPTRFVEYNIDKL